MQFYQYSICEWNKSSGVKFLWKVLILAQTRHFKLCILAIHVVIIIFPYKYDIFKVSLKVVFENEWASKQRL